MHQRLMALSQALVPSATQDIQTRMAECPAVGLHWDNIGFQGSDPCTDVNRSMKMLAVLQVSVVNLSP